MTKAIRDEHCQALLEGFEGFLTFTELRESNLSQVPRDPGTYAILVPLAGEPQFLEASCGGAFKGRNPTVPVKTIRERWIDDCCLVYIGKATSLRTRLGQYSRFGQGRPVGHWGGRYIWQLASSENLLVAWKTTLGDPRDDERRLLERFTLVFGRLPFANLVA